MLSELVALEANEKSSPLQTTANGHVQAEIENRQEAAGL